MTILFLLLCIETENRGTYNAYITSSFGERINFEALLEPERYLANKNLYSAEPDHLSPRVKIKMGRSRG